MDRVFIDDILARCIIGVRDYERKEPQEILISVSLSVDLSKPGKSDDFEDTVDYSLLKDCILEMAESSRFYLIEALAERTAEICLENPMVKEATVTVKKPSALRFVRTVGVEITRKGDR
ncbi:MAG: dihydroneopterin aldolase [Armatimonadota bacterium]